MKIGINGRFLTKPFTGIGQYTKYLLLEMAQQVPNDTFIVIVPRKVEIDSDLPKNIELQIVKHAIPGGGGLSKTYWEQVQVPRAMRKAKVDVVHFPYPANPWRGFDKPVVVTVHDAIPWTLREYRRRWLSRLYHGRTLNALHKADRLIAVSQATKDEVLDLFSSHQEPLNADHFSVTHNAPSPLFLKNISDEDVHKTVSRYVMGPADKRPYFLYVGGYDSRKNVRMLVEVFRKDIAPKFAIDLVLVGGKSLQDDLYESFDEAVAGDDGVQKGNIIATGYVPEEDLPALYRGCFAFVNVSTKEGFNLPLVEAMVSGAVVVTSDTAVHHEVCGESALFVDKVDKAGLSDLLLRLVSNGGFYEAEKMKVRAYECPYSWEGAAKEVLKVYKEMV